MADSLDDLKKKLEEFEKSYEEIGIAIVALNQFMCDMQSCCDAIRKLLGDVEKETLEKWQENKRDYNENSTN